MIIPSPLAHHPSVLLISDQWLSKKILLSEQGDDDATLEVDAWTSLNPSTGQRRVVGNFWGQMSEGQRFISRVR